MVLKLEQALRQLPNVLLLSSFLDLNFPLLTAFVPGNTLKTRAPLRARSCKCCISSLAICFCTHAFSLRDELAGILIRKVARHVDAVGDCVRVIRVRRFDLIDEYSNIHPLSILLDLDHPLLSLFVPGNTLKARYRSCSSRSSRTRSIGSIDLDHVVTIFFRKNGRHARANAGDGLCVCFDLVHSLTLKRLHRAIAWLGDATSTGTSRQACNIFLIGSRKKKLKRQERVRFWIEMLFIFVALSSALPFKHTEAPPPTKSVTTLADRLFFAAETGDIAAVDELLQRGANVDAVSKAGATALALAARHGHVGIIELLIRAGARIDLGMRHVEHGVTALYIASRYGQHAVVDLLIASGAEKAKAAPWLELAMRRKERPEFGLVTSVPREMFSRREHFEQPSHSRAGDGVRLQMKVRSEREKLDGERERESDTAYVLKCTALHVRAAYKREADAQTFHRENWGCARMCCAGGNALSFQFAGGAFFLAPLFSKDSRFPPPLFTPLSNRPPTLHS